LRILIPQGIGDALWALHKVQGLAQKHGDGRIEVSIACSDAANPVECRSLEFVRRFLFVDRAVMHQMPCKPKQQGCLLQPGPPADVNGYYRYISEGPHAVPGIDWLLLPNTSLERGIPLADWLPDIPINWDVMHAFQFKAAELEFAEQLAGRLGPYVVFFMASMTANTTAGHNRGGLWRPDDWIELGRRLRGIGLQIVVVGADYDNAYYDRCVAPHVTGWHNHIGQWDSPQLFAVLNHARFVVSYQSGIGIVPSALGRPLAIFWRARGDSILPNMFVSFEESMASAWVHPDALASGRHLPLIYGRHDVDYIMREIVTRGW
jgi:hypothetical protein